MRFSPSLQINDLLRKLLICAAVRGRDADFLRSCHPCPVSWLVGGQAAMVLPA